MLEDQIQQYMQYGVVVILWIFVAIAIRAMARDTRRAAGGGASASKRARKLKKGAPRYVQAGDQRLDLDGLTEVTLGRSPTNTFPLADDYASGTHARLMLRGTSWILEDSDSRNGTFVNGVKIDQPETVDTTSEIKIGQTLVRLVP